MAEIRLGSVPNMKNINLGSIEIQEIYLGQILVWQNNQAPVWLQLTWDGTSFTAPAEVGDMWNGSASSAAADRNGVRTISLVVGTLSDPDNIDEDTDFIVGYRLQRPDSSWVAGDPANTGNNAFGAPIAEFGAPLPGVTATWDAGEEEFTAGSLAVASTTIPVLLSDLDKASPAVIVDSITQEFKDDGIWKLILIDSRGGESEPADLDITLNYANATGVIESNQAVGGANALSVGTNFSTSASSPTLITNSTIGGPSSITLAIEQTGGPLSTTPASRYSWACVSGCTCSGTGTTQTVTIPQYAGGSGTPCRLSATLTGRGYLGNAAMTTPVTHVYFHSGASCSPSISVGDSSFSFTPDTSPAVCSGAEAPASYSVTCSGTCTGFSYTSGTSFDQPNPGCVGFDTIQTARVDVSGSTTGALSGIPASGANTTYRGSYPQVAGNACAVTVECTGAPPAIRNSACGTVVNTTVACTGTTCAGAPANTEDCNGALLPDYFPTETNNYDGGDNVSSGFCNGGTATAYVNYSAIRPTYGIDCGGGVDVEVDLPAGSDTGAFAQTCVVGQINDVDINMLPTINTKIADGGACTPGGTFRVLFGCAFNTSQSTNGFGNTVNCTSPLRINCV